MKPKIISIILLFSVIILSIIACKREYLNPCDSDVPDNWPVIKCDTAYIDMNKVVFKGSITKSISKITQYGFCWSENHTPTIADKKINLGEATGAKQFQVNPDSLVQSKTYHLRAFATNLSKTVYSNDILFTPQVQMSIINISFSTPVTTKVEGTIKGTFLQGVIPTEYGICYATNNIPTYTNDKLSLGTFCKDTIFTLYVLNLTNIADLYFKVFGINLNEIKYSSAFKYTVPLPRVITNSVLNITQTTAKINGDVSNDGGVPVTAKGICWSTLFNPTIADNYTSDGTGVGSFTSNINGLTANSLYYVRAYAINSSGLAYGNEINFTTSGNCGIITDIDGNNYNTVVIGSQCWLQENLKTTKYRDGTVITNVTDNSAWNNLTTGAYCDYGNVSSNSIIYGKLYNWYAVTNVHNICPTGWHIPSDSEWNIIGKYLDSTVDTTASSGWTGTDIGGTLKNTGLANWNSPNTGATNSSGFSALPGGNRLQTGEFSNIKDYGNWWSATDESTWYAWRRTLSYDNSQISRYSGYFDKNAGFSVRCLKDF